MREPLRGVHRRRVPGREPAPADAARPVARPARRPLRRRRRLPVDLRVHRRLAALAARDARAVRRRRPSSASRRTTARPRRSSSSRTGSSRGSAAPRRSCGRRGRPGRSRSTRPFATAESEDEWLVDEVKRLARRGRAARGGGDPLPHERAPGRLRGGAARGGAAVPGVVAARARRGAAAAPALVGDGSTDVAGRVRALAEEAGWLVNLPDKLGERELTRQADLARLVRLAEELDDGERTCDGFAAELRRRFDPGGDGGARRAPAHLPPREGPRVRRRLPAAARRQGAAVEARTHRGGSCRGAAAALRRHDACAQARLALTWSRRPSPFLAELGVEDLRRLARPCRRRRRPPRDRSPAAEALRRWRLERARSEGVPGVRDLPRPDDRGDPRAPPVEPGGARGDPRARARRGSRGSAASSTAWSRRLALGARSREARARRAPSRGRPRRADRPSRGSGRRLRRDPAAGIYHALAAWRRDRARTEDVPPFTCSATACSTRSPAPVRARTRSWPRSRASARSKLERYGDDVLEVVPPPAVHRPRREPVRTAVR